MVYYTGRILRCEQIVIFESILHEQTKKRNLVKFLWRPIIDWVSNTYIYINAMCYLVATGLYYLRLYIFHNICLIYLHVTNAFALAVFFFIFATRTSFMTFERKVTQYIYIYNSNFARTEICLLLRHFLDFFLYKSTQTFVYLKLSILTR